VSATQGRLFSDEELEDMGRRTFDRVLDRLAAGDVPGAEAATRRMFNEFESMHRLYRRWVTATLTFIVERYGQDVLEEAMEAGVQAWWTPNLEKLVEGSDSVAQRIRWFASGLRGHLVGLAVEEDAEKVVIQMTPCGSGGRLLMEGAYEGDDAFASLPPSPQLTYGLPDCPIYCAHQPLMERIAIERYGSPLVVIEPSIYCTTRGDPDRIPEAERHCAFLIYKDPDKVPDHYFERLGVTRPTTRKEDGG
jgi:hypothetical protein